MRCRGWPHAFEMLLRMMRSAPTATAREGPRAEQIPRSRPGAKAAGAPLEARPDPSQPAGVRNYCLLLNAPRVCGCLLRGSIVAIAE